METDTDANKQPLAQRQCCSDTARCANMLSPHIGLIFMLCLYTVCGAAIIQAVEQPHYAKAHRNSMDDIHKKRDTMLRKMFDDIMKYGHDYEFDAWRSGIMDELDNFTRSLCTACHVENVAVSDIITNTTSTSWTLPQSIYFATTVITTIGNSNIVPRTMTGRILSIVFALLGIPLLLITIADIGKFMENLFACLYKKIRRTESDEDEFLQVPMVLLLAVFLVYLALGAALIYALEGWGYFEAFYFCFNTTAAIGAGDVIPSTPVMFIAIAYMVIGLSLTRLCFDYAGTDYIRTIHYFGRKCAAK